MFFLVALIWKPYKILLRGTGWSLQWVLQLHQLLLRVLAVDIKVLASLGRDELKKICGDSFPEWISFPKFEQVKWLNKQLNKLWPYIADLIGHSLVVIAESETSKGIGVRFVPAEGTRDVNALSYPGSSEG